MTEVTITLTVLQLWAYRLAFAVIFSFGLLRCAMAAISAAMLLLQWAIAIPRAQGRAEAQKPRKKFDMDESMMAHIAGYEHLSDVERSAPCPQCGHPTWICRTWGCQPKDPAA